jgi:Protein of unknown function (DUF3592)
MILTVLSVMGAALVTLGVAMAAREHSWLQKAQVGPGKVVELVTKTSSGRAPSFTRRVQYTAHDGSIHDFIRNLASSRAAFAVGEDVQVAYDPQTYEARILTFGQRFGFAAVAIIVGLSLVLIKVTFTYGERLLPRIYAAQTADGRSTRVR